MKRVRIVPEGKTCGWQISTGRYVYVHNECERRGMSLRQLHELMIDDYAELQRKKKLLLSSQKKSSVVSDDDVGGVL